MRPFKIPILAIIFLFSFENIHAQCIARYTGPDPQTVCVNTPMTSVVYRVVSGVTGVTPDGLPAGVSGVFSLADLTYTLSGSPSVVGTYIYTLTTTGSCVGLVVGTIYVIPGSALNLTSPPPTASQTVCEDSPIDNIVFSVGGSATGAGVTGLPSGVNYIFSAGVLTISGAPAIAGTFPYLVTTTGPCAPVTFNGTIRVNPNAIITLTSALGTDNQTRCIFNPITNITYQISGGGTGAYVDGLPAGVTYSYNNPSDILTISGTPSVSGVSNYIVTTTGTCAQTTANGTITVNANSTISSPAPAGSNNQTLCINIPITSINYTIGGGATGADVADLPPGVTGTYNAGTRIFTISGTPTVAGTFNFTVTTRGPCIQAVANGSIRVNPDAVITLTSAPATENQNVCQNNPIVPITYSVTGGGTSASASGLPPGVTGVFSAGIFTISGTPTALGPFPYTVTTTGNSCVQKTRSGSINVAANAVLTLTSAPGTTNQNVCANSPVTNITYNVSGGATGAIVLGLPAGVTGVFNILTSVFTISGTPTLPGPSHYTVTTTGTCNQVSLSGDITVSATPVATASNSGPVCVGSPLALVGGPAGMTAYSWTGPNSFASPLQSPQVSASATLAMSGVYLLTVTNINGCQDTASTRAYVYAVPVANAGTGGSECDLNFVLSAVPSVLTSTGSWTMVTGPGAAVFSPGPNIPGATVSVTAYGTYIFRWTETNGPCSSSADVTVNFNRQPVANPGTGGNKCDLNFALNAVPSAGIGHWRVVSGPGTATFAPNDSTANAVVTVTAYGTYVFSWTEVNGTCTSSANITVNFYQQPVANPGTGGNNCGRDFIFNAVPSVGTGTWTRVSGPGTATFSPNANLATARVTVSAYGTYVFSWTEQNFTCSDSKSITVVFILSPSADAGEGGNECDRNFALNAQLTSGTGTWSKQTGPGTATFTPNANQPNATVTVSEFGEYDFLWTVVNSTCTTTDVIKVRFHDRPTVSAGPDLAVCIGSGIQLTATGDGPTWAWTPANLLNNPGIQNPVATPAVNTVFTVTMTDQFGCKNTDQVNVEVREKPVADAGPDQVLDYLFDTFMQALPVSVPDTGTWTVSHGGGEFSDANDAAAHVTDLSLGVNSFLWTVSNGACPDEVDTVNITVNNLVIPTLITPNQDGKNDFFVIRGIATLGTTSLVVFDRWGARVYDNAKYDNSWDGTDFNGQALPPDTYFFVLKPEKSRPVTGYVVIRR